MASSTGAPNISTAIMSQETHQYEQLLADVWVGILLSAILISCVCCMCSCIIYHKFQKWKRLVLQDGEAPEILTREASISYDCESLPSYTIASGLPSYEEAIRQLEIVKIQKVVKEPHLLTPSQSRVSLMSCIHSAVVSEKKQEMN